MTKNILEFLNLLKHRPKLFVSDELDSTKLKIYLIGVVNGIEYTNNSNLSKQLFHWVRKKTIIDYDIAWEAMIFSFYKDKTDEELKLILIETLEEFFTENPDWYKE